MKKRLVIFHPAIAPYRTDFFNSLNERFEATFYFEFGNALEQSFAQDVLKKRLDFEPRYLSPGFCGIKNLRLQVWPILREAKPDVVFCSEYNIMGLLILLYKFLCNRKLQIFTICDDSRDIAQSTKGVKKWMRALQVRLYSGVILASDEVVAWYEDYFKMKGKFMFFPIIQRDDTFRSLLSSAFPRSGELVDELELRGKQVVFFVGRLIGIKNLSFLMECFSALVDKYPRALLLFVGEGEDAPTLRNLARELDIENRVLLVGKKEGSELYAYYNIGQVFVLPSYFEPFGAVVNEALLAGCYTLCSSAAGASCLLRSAAEGASFDPYDKLDLTEKLDFSLRHCTPLDQVEVRKNRMPYSYEESAKRLFEDLNLIIKK